MRNDDTRRYVHQRAWHEAARVLGLVGTAEIVIRVLLFCAYVGAVWWLFSRAEAESEAWLVFLAILPPVLAFPVVYLWKRDRIQAEIIARTAAQIEQAQGLLSPKPRLRMRVKSLAFGGVSEEQPNERSFTFFLEVFNMGERATAALNWRALFHVPKAEGILFAPTEIDTLRLNSALSDGPNLSRKDAIQEKTYDPIPDGGVRSGFFFVLVPNDVFNELQVESEVTLECEQVDGVVCSCTFKPFDGQILPHLPMPSGMSR